MPSPSAAVAHRKSQSTFAAELVSSVKAVRAKRTGLIYISNGYQLDEPAFHARIERLALAARDSHVRILAIDPRVLRDAVAGDPGLDAESWKNHLSMTQQPLRVLAGKTGGLALIDADAAAGALRKIVAFQR
jgi:hypothetical protein